MTKSTNLTYLAAITDQMKEDPALHEHVKFFSREMRIRAYQQFLESYRSVQLRSMANAFGVSEGYLDAYEVSASNF